MADVDIKVTADASQAKSEIDSTSASVAHLGDVSGSLQDPFQGFAQQAGGSLKEVGKSATEAGTQVEGMVGKLGAIGGVVSAVLATFALFYKGTREVIDGLKEYGVDIDSASRSLVEKFVPSQSSAADEANEFANIQKILKARFNETADSLEDGREKLERLSRSYRDAGVAAEGMQKKIFGNVDAIRKEEEATVSAINAQLKLGSLTAEEYDAAAKAVQNLLDKLARAGEAPSAALADLADTLSVLSSKQEDAAEATKKHAEEADKAADKLRAESEAVTDSGKAVDTLLPKLQAFADGKREQAKATDEATAALRAEIQALADQAKAAEDASKGANQKAQDAAKRIKELEGEAVLTVDQQNELNSLKEQQVTLDQDAAEAADTAAQATFDYGDAQASLADATSDASGALKDQSSGATHAASVMAELDAATKAYDKTLADVGDQAQSTTAYVEAVGENGQKIWTNFTDTIVEGNEAIGDAADGLGKVPAALDQVTPAAERAGEGLAGLNEFLDKSEGGGFSKTATDVASMNEELEKSYDLAQKIRTEFERINSTISGAGG